MMRTGMTVTGHQQQFTVQFEWKVHSPAALAAADVAITPHAISLQPATASTQADDC